MTIPMLPEHLLKGESMQQSRFFQNPVGTGPYRLERWDVGQAITLVKNEQYFKGGAKIDRIILKSWRMTMRKRFRWNQENWILLS
ncbi:hypothetical protein C823_003194 [Eubacterium plexicaudatum ASF492]|nr:hypothetical protein C823_003194 [Eubacterium plexicaudatum ASF492]